MSLVRKLFFFSSFFRKDELDLTAPNKAAMLSLPIEKKWQIYCSRKKNLETEENESHQPEHYVERVRVLAQVRILF